MRRSAFALLLCACSSSSTPAATDAPSADAGTTDASVTPPECAREPIDASAWVRCIPNLRTTSLAAIGTTGVAIAGYEVGPTFKGTHVSIPGMAAHVGRFDAKGSRLFGKKLEGVRPPGSRLDDKAGRLLPLGPAVAANASGSIALVATYIGDLDLGSGITLPRVETDFPGMLTDAPYVARFDSSGKCLWARSLPRGGGSSRASVVIDDEGSVSVVADGFGKVGPHKAEGPFVAHFGPLGDEQWVRLAPYEINYPNMGWITVGASGTLTLAGLTTTLKLRGTGDDTTMLEWVIEHTKDGEKTWEFTAPYVLVSSFAPMRARKLPSGETISIGRASKPEIKTIAVRRFDSAGKLLGTKEANVPELVFGAASFAMLSDDRALVGVYAAGYGTTLTLLTYAHDLTQRRYNELSVRAPAFVLTDDGHPIVTGGYDLENFSAVSLDGSPFVPGGSFARGSFLWRATPK